jgi:hypothetical protein
MRVTFTIVVVLFALMGAMYLLGSTAILLGLHTPGQPVASRYDQLIDGFEGLGFGVVYAITALGLYKRNYLARYLAMILVIWNFFGAISNFFSGPSIVVILWLAGTIYVPVCLFTASVRTEFAVAKTEAKFS